MIVNSSNKDENISKASKDQKPLKGILKGFSSPDDNEPKKIDPKLISIIREINSHNAKAKYSKEQIENLLAPYKATG